jgi:hypothetical protein
MHPSGPVSKSHVSPFRHLTPWLPRPPPQFVSPIYPMPKSAIKANRLPSDPLVGLCSTHGSSKWDLQVVSAAEKGPRTKTDYLTFSPQEARHQLVGIIQSIIHPTAVVRAGACNKRSCSTDMDFVYIIYTIPGTPNAKCPIPSPGCITVHP